MGLVFVLLLGDIDLSAGVAGGVSACAMGADHRQPGWPWWAAMLAGIAAGALIGLAIGLLRAKLGIPSFVVTLAFFLGLQGVTLKLIGEGGSVRVDDPVIRGITIDNLSVTVGWICALLDRGRVRRRWSSTGYRTQGQRWDWSTHRSGVVARAHRRLSPR